MSLTINIDRLITRLNQVNSIGRLPGGGVSRPALSDEDKAARVLLEKWANELGLLVQVDEMGNMFCLWKGATDKVLATGSHLDTVPTGGDYDGSLGVMASLEVLATLKENGYVPHHSLVLTNFTNEEGTRFTPDMMGSLGYANPDHVSFLHSCKAVDNQKSVIDELKRIGYYGKMKCGAMSFEKFIELHIEQGPILEIESRDIGIVEGVQGIHWKKLTIEGRSAHAGTTPIELRKDPLFALTCLSVYLRELCAMEKGLLATIGSLQVVPNAINVVPKRVVVTLDIRHPDDDAMSRAKKAIVDFMDKDESFKNLSIEEEVLVDIKAVKFDQKIVKAIRQVSDQLGYSNRPMISGAGHDAQLLSTRYPAAMIFIPSKDGVSHAVDEYSSPAQIEKGANVLLQTMILLDNAN